MLGLPEGGASQDTREPGSPALTHALLPSLSTHLAAKAWLLFAHGPLVSAIPLFSSVGHDREVYLPASSLGPPGLEPRGSQHWGRVWWPQGGGREPRPCAGGRREAGSTLLHSVFMNSREKPSFLSPLMKLRARVS